jgi:AcrR family transcriptional regulator
MTKSERTRQFIIEQSASIINKKGVAGTAISDLMEATKLAKGGIYGNFETKDEICIEAFDYLTGIVARGLDSAIAAKRTAREKLFTLLDYYNDNLASGEVGGCPLLNFGTEADDTNPELKQRVAKAIKRSQQRITKLIEEGQAAGE